MTTPEDENGKIVHIRFRLSMNWPFISLCLCIVFISAFIFSFIKKLTYLFLKTSKRTKVLKVKKIDLLKFLLPPLGNPLGNSF